MINSLMTKLIDLEAFDRLVGTAESRTGADSIFAKVRDEIGIRTRIEGLGFESIPHSGPLVVVANHPTGFAEGVAIPALLDARRDDVFVMGHTFFERWPSLAKRMVLVEPQSGKGDHAGNGRAVVRAARRIRNGSCMLMFPAGSVARPRSFSLEPKEGVWHKGLANIVRLSGAAILPIHVAGSPSLLFRAVTSLHPRLGVPLLFREALRANRETMKVNVGSIITAEEFLDFGPAAQAVGRVRMLLNSLCECASVN